MYCKDRSEDAYRRNRRCDSNITFSKVEGKKIIVYTLKIKFLNCLFWVVLRKNVALDVLNVSHSQRTWHIKAVTATLRSTGDSISN